MAGAEHVRAEPAARRARAPAPLEHAKSVGIFGADVDVALGRPDGRPAIGHALDQHERVALKQHAVGEGAAVALVGVADDVFLVRLDARDRAPFDPGREARAAAPAQARHEHFLDRRLGADLDRASSPLPPPWPR